MTEPTLRDCINYMKQQLKGMEKYPKSYEFNIPYYRKTIEYLEAGRPHGEWTSNSHDLELFCSVCGGALPYSDEYTYEADFCPNCGVDMRREGDSDA